MTAFSAFLQELGLLGGVYAVPIGAQVAAPQGLVMGLAVTACRCVNAFAIIDPCSCTPLALVLNQLV